MDSVRQILPYKLLLYSRGTRRSHTPFLIVLTIISNPSQIGALLSGAHKPLNVSDGSGASDEGMTPAQVTFLGSAAESKSGLWIFWNESATSPDLAWFPAVTDPVFAVEVDALRQDLPSCMMHWSHSF